MKIAEEAFRYSPCIERGKKNTRKGNETAWILSDCLQFTSQAQIYGLSAFLCHSISGNVKCIRRKRWQKIGLPLPAPRFPLFLLMNGHTPQQTSLHSNTVWQRYHSAQQTHKLYINTEIQYELMLWWCCCIRLATGTNVERMAFERIVKTAFSEVFSFYTRGIQLK